MSCLDNVDTSYYWSEDKEKRAYYAKKHTEKMFSVYKNAIEECVKNTIKYDASYPFNLTESDNYQMHVHLSALDSVSAIMRLNEGRTAVLNFASYKEPGGMFLAGSRAQEECLCAESFLYNVLCMNKEYYDWNKKNLNKALYLDRALYSPDVRFEKDEKCVLCDVITCAAPNITPSKKYGWNVSDEENRKTLKDRIDFVVKIAADRSVDTLILGAFGCGVFGQDPEEVCRLFIDSINKYPKFIKVVFAVKKDVHSKNYDAFKRVLQETYGLPQK